MAYGLTIFLAIFVCIFIAERQVKSHKMSVEIFWECIFWVLVFGLVGARLYHVLDFWNLYAQNPLSIFFVWNGGLGIFGALIFGALTAAIFLSRRKQPLFDWLDIFALVLPLGQAIGRLGNYFNNELLPYAFYEAAADLGLFATLLALRERTKKSGAVTFTYLLGYAAIRFFLEPFRTERWEICGINTAQAISAILILVAIINLWKIKREK